MVALENRRAQEAIAMRRLQFDEPLEGDDASQIGENTPDGDPA